MNNELILKGLKEITRAYSKDEIDEIEVQGRLLNIGSADEIIDNDNDLIVSSFFALLHLTGENGFETPPAEIHYLYECLDGRRRFSNEERSKFLKNNQHLNRKRQ